MLDYIVGFRKRKKLNMILAAVYYLLCIALSAASGKMFLFSFVMTVPVPFVVCSVIDAVREKKFKKLIALPVWFVAVVLAAVVSPGKSAPKPEKILLTSGDISFENIGDSVTVGYTAEPENADVSGVQLVSENPSVASFDGNVLTAVAEGETFVYAKTEDVSSDKIAVVIVDKQAEIMRRAKAVEDEIGKLGEITLDSRAAIDEAKAVYDSAPEEVKEKVTNYNVIAEAEATYAALEAEAAEQERAEREAEERAAAELAKQNEDSGKENGGGTKKSSGSSSGKSSGSSSGKSSGGSSAASSGTVYIGKTGTKYHKKSCSTLKGNGIPISIEEAKAQGRQACKVCGG